MLKGGRARLPDENLGIDIEPDENLGIDIKPDNKSLLNNNDIKPDKTTIKPDTQKSFVVTSEIILNAYPNNLFYSNGDKHYKTPILITHSSIKEGKFSNSNFESLFNEIKTNNKDNTDIANITLEQCLTQYNSIIDNPEKHSDIHYLINLFLLLQNDVSCFNISNSFVNVKETDKIMKGGMDEQREINRLQRPENIQPYDEPVNLADREEEIIQLGPGNNLLVYLIPSTVVFIGLCALASLFGMPVEDPVFISSLIAASIIITSNGGRRILNLIGNGANDNLIPYVQGNRLIDTGIRGLRRAVNITLIQPNIERLVGNGIIRPMALINPNIRLQRLIINNDQFDDDLRQRLRLLDQEREQRAIRDAHVADAIRAGDNPQLNAIDAGRNEELVAHAASEQAVRDNLRQQVADAEQQGNERLVAYANGVQAELDNLRQQLADAQQRRIEEYARPLFELQHQADIQVFLKEKQAELEILIPHFSEKQSKTQLQTLPPIPSEDTLFYEKLREQWRQYFMGWKEPPASWPTKDPSGVTLTIDGRRNAQMATLLKDNIPFFIDNVQFEGIYKQQLKGVQESYLKILEKKMDFQSAKRFMLMKLDRALESIFNNLPEAPTEVVQRYNKLRCPRCSYEFQFNEELGYICNLSMVGASESQQLMDKLNVFPSIDLIESITPLAVANNIGYQFNDKFGDEGPQTQAELEVGAEPKVYGEYLTCSQCAIDKWLDYDINSISMPFPLKFPRADTLPAHMRDIQVKNKKMMLDIWNRVYSTDILSLIEQEKAEEPRGGETDDQRKRRISGAQLKKADYDRIRKLCINSLHKYKTYEQRQTIMEEFVNYYITTDGWYELNEDEIKRAGEEEKEDVKAKLNAVSEEEKKKKSYSYFLEKEETFQRGADAYKDDRDDKIKYMIISCPTCIKAFHGPLTNSFYELRKANKMDNLFCHCNACQTDFNGYTGSEIKLLPESVEREIMIAIGNHKNNIYPTFVDAYRRHDLEKQQAEGRLFSIRRATLKSILLAREWKRLGVADQEINVLKGQNKQCPNCKIPAMHESGCSQMMCGKKDEQGKWVGGCGTEWCYICGEATIKDVLFSGQGHDSKHFLINIDAGAGPFGGYYALQCCNVNWTIKDIGGDEGEHHDYRQVVSFTSKAERDASEKSGIAPRVPSTYERWHQVSRNLRENLLPDQQREYDKIYGYWIKTQVLYRKFAHINESYLWWKNMQGSYWAGIRDFQGLDKYHVIGRDVYDSDPMIGIHELDIRVQNNLLNRVLAAYPNDNLAKMKTRLNSINEQIQNAPQDGDDDKVIVNIQAIRQQNPDKEEGDEEAAEVKDQGQQYQVPDEGLSPILVQMLNVAPNVPEDVRARIIQAPERVVRVENQPINDAVLAQLLGALGEEFNPADAEALRAEALRAEAEAAALRMDANRGLPAAPVDGPVAGPVVGPDQGNDLRLNPGEPRQAMEQQEILDQGGDVDEFGLNPDQRQAALELQIDLQPFFEQAQAQAQAEAEARAQAQAEAERVENERVRQAQAQRAEALRAEARAQALRAEAEARAQEAERRRQWECAVKNEKYALFKKCFAQIRKETEPIVRREAGVIIKQPREGKRLRIRVQNPIPTMNSLLRDNPWLVDRLRVEGWYDENRGYVINDVNINDVNINDTMIKDRKDINQERLAPVMLEWEQQLAARAAARAAAEEEAKAAADENQGKWQALIEDLDHRRDRMEHEGVDDVYKMDAIEKVIKEAQRKINQNEPYPIFNNKNDEESMLTLHLNTIAMCEKIIHLGLPIVNIHFCKYTSPSRHRMDKYHLLFDLYDGIHSRIVEYNSEAKFIERPRNIGELYPEIDGRVREVGSIYTIKVSDGTDSRVVYNILESILTKYRALENHLNDNDNYFDLSELLIDIWDNSHFNVSNLQRVFISINEEQQIAENPDLGGGSGNKKRKVTKKRKNRVYVSGKKNKNNTRKKKKN